MCATGAIRVGMAVPIIMGQNIGTCITALLSSVGAGKNAKRAAFIHLYFNLGGTVALLALFYLLSFLGPLSSDATASEATVAFIHTAFNVGATALWLPLSGQLVQLATHTVREGGKAPQKADGGGLPAVREEYTLLDERFLNAPAVALEVAGAAFSRMCEMAFGEFLLALLQCGEYEDTRQAEITRCEALWRRYERSLSSYLVKLSSVKMHASAAAEVSRLLLLLPDITRVGERAAGIAAGAGERKRDAVPLSHAAVKELAVLRDAVDELTAHTKAALFDGERGEASRVGALTDVLSRICADLRRRHVARLREGNCHTDAARIFASWICDVESFCDHCRRLAAPAAQENALHGGKDTRRAHAEFSEKYRLQE